jgi:hypothetical protein
MNCLEIHQLQNRLFAARGLGVPQWPNQPCDMRSRSSHSVGREQSGASGVDAQLPPLTTLPGSSRVGCRSPGAAPSEGAQCRFPGRSGS